MKKIQLVALILLLCLAGTYNGSAQDDSQGSSSLSGFKFSFGGQVGSSFSGFSRYGQTFSAKRLGGTAGAFAKYNVLPYLDLSLELNYAMLGANNVSPDLVYRSNPYAVNPDLYKYASDVLLHSFQLPILVNISPLSDGDIVPRICLGYSIDYYFKALAKDYFETDYPDYMVFTDRNFANVSSNFAKWNQSVIGGFGLDFKNTRPKCSIEARYQLGLFDMSKIKGLHTVNLENNFSVNSFSIYFKFYL